MKFYENLRFVYRSNRACGSGTSSRMPDAAAAPAEMTDDRRLPVPDARANRPGATGRRSSSQTNRGFYELSQSSGNTRRGLLPHLRQTACAKRASGSAQGTIFCDEHAARRSRERAGTACAAYAHAGVSGAAVADPSVSPGSGALCSGLHSRASAPFTTASTPRAWCTPSSSDCWSASSAPAHAGGLEPLFGILIAVWVFYMGIEAYHTARKRRAGEPVDEFSSLIDLHARGSALSGRARCC